LVLCIGDILFVFLSSGDMVSPAKLTGLESSMLPSVWKQYDTCAIEGCCLVKVTENLTDKTVLQRTKYVSNNAKAIANSL
jgi:hypothetical protein